MKNFSTWMLVMFMIMFWVFRIIVALAYQLHWNFGGFTPLNETIEIMLLFVVIGSLVLIVKRKLVGGLIYLLGYGMYFGADLTRNINVLIASFEGRTPEVSATANLLVAIIGLILPIAIMMDLLMDKSRRNNPKDKKTDWFYTNEQYDREMDERADKNNYRTL